MSLVSKTAEKAKMQSMQDRKSPAVSKHQPRKAGRAGGQLMTSMVARSIKGPNLGGG